MFLHNTSRRVVFYSEQSTRLSSPTSRQKVAFGVTSISVQTGPRTRFPASTGQSESSTQWSRGPSRQIELRVIPSDDEGGWRGIEGTTTHVERGNKARSKVTTGTQCHKQIVLRHVKMKNWLQKDPYEISSLSTRIVRKTI